MLTELEIRNFAIIRSQSIHFKKGLNVISGETGAGKSIILQALELILGGRPSPKYLIPGTDGWEIQALFQLEGLPEDLRLQLPDIANTEELMVSRSMNVSGRGKVYINGRIATVQLLQEVCSVLVQICSQGGQSRLLDPDFHLELIDDYARAGSLRERYESAWSLWRSKQKELQVLEEQRQKSLLRTAELHYVIDELGSISLGPGTVSSYEEQIRELEEAENVITTGQELQELFGAPDGVYSLLGQVRAQFENLSRMSSKFAAMPAQIKEAVVLLQESELELEKILSGTEGDEATLEDLRSKLSEILRLQRKYTTDEVGLQSLLDTARRELELIQDERGTESLKSEIAELERQMKALGEELSEKRADAAIRLVESVTSDLNDLNMKSTRLHVLHERVECRASGLDKIEFMLASAKGEKLYSLRDIASGGELSRILLVLKKVLRDKTGVNVLVFDEVDTGISGGVARAVGEKLRAVAAESQVICITHLAQVASLADSHLLVHKSDTDCGVRELSEEEKIEEIARMLAGYKVTAASRESARELLTSI